MDRILRSASLLALLPLAGPAFADARLAIPCPNGVPCSLEVSGHVDTVGAARLPWTASVVVPADVCFFVETVTSDGPTEVSIVTPDGRVKSGAQVSRTTAGWHTVEIDSPVAMGEQLFRARLVFLKAENCAGPPPE